MQVKAPCVFSKKTMSVCKNCSKGFPLNKSATQEKIDRQDPIVYLSLIPIFMGRALIILIYHQGVVQYNMVLTRLVTLPINSHHQDIYIHLPGRETPNKKKHLHLPRKKLGRWTLQPPRRFNPTNRNQGVFEATELRKRSSERYEQKFVSWGAAPFGVWSKLASRKMKWANFSHPGWLEFFWEKIRTLGSRCFSKFGRWSNQPLFENMRKSKWVANFFPKLSSMVKI